MVKKKILDNNVIALSIPLRKIREWAVEMMTICDPPLQEI